MGEARDEGSQAVYSKFYDDSFNQILRLLPLEAYLFAEKAELIAVVGLTPDSLRFFKSFKLAFYLVS